MARSGEACPGCGVRLPAADWSVPAGVRASPACFLRYGELTSETFGRGDAAFVHQFAVDAYTAQHVGPDTKPVATFFSLVGLCLACERGLSGREVQRAHQALARVRRRWPHFEAPAERGALTVAEVLRVELPRRDESLLAWARSVWAAWGPAHEEVRGAIRAWLPVVRKMR